MSPTEESIGAPATMSRSELSRVRVNTPGDPPSKVHSPGDRGGISCDPWMATFGLFGKFVLP